MSQNRQHHNVFWQVEDLDTGAFPLIVLDMLPSGLKPVTVVLYLYILRQSKIDNWGIVRCHTKEVLTALGVTDKTLKAAREQLTEFNLVSSAETKQRGIWEYEILNPSTGGALPSRENVDFASLPNEVVFQFYLRLMPDRWDEEQGKFWCPFGKHATPRFNVNFDPGTDRHATWNCSRCSKSGDFGGLIQFFRRMRDTSEQEATRRTRSILQTLIQQELQSRHKAAEEIKEFANMENSKLAMA